MSPTFMDVDVDKTAPQSGFETLPPGWYLLKMIDATDAKMERNGEHLRRNYKTKVLYGPMNPKSGQDPQACVNKTFYDRIRETPEWHGRHMELWAACLGSTMAVRQIAHARGGRFDVETLHERQYLALITVNNNFNNVARRVPDTEANRNLILADEDPDPIVDDGVPAPGNPATVPTGAPAGAPPMATTAPQPPMTGPPAMAATAPPQPPAGGPPPVAGVAAGPPPVAGVAPGPPPPPTQTPGQQ